MLALVLSVLFQSQSDPGPLLEQLRSDSVVVREEAGRSLERLGPGIIDRLKKELEANSDLETKLRLRQLIERIPKIAELAKVYGPTRRVTLSAHDRPLSEVTSELGKALEESIGIEGLDPGQAVTLDLKEATLWEALDRLAKTTKSSYAYLPSGIRFKKGQMTDLPVLYFEQFRISLAEVKYVDHRSPGVSEAAVLLAPEVAFQRNLKPTGGKWGNTFAIESTQDAAGADVRCRAPAWASGINFARQPFSLQQHLFVRSVGGPVTIQGTATVSFSQENREIAIAVKGENREAETPEVKFSLSGYTETPAATTITLKADSSVPGSYERVKSVWLVDHSGKRHRGSPGRGEIGPGGFTHEFSFPAGVTGKEVVFEWAATLRPVEIPFRLTGIRIP
jgi:hypothetical protein